MLGVGVGVFEGLEGLREAPGGVLETLKGGKSMNKKDEIVDGMADKELEEALVTCDGRGKGFKVKALEEIRRRAWNLGMLGCKLDFMEK